MKCPSCKRELRVSAKELNCDCGASWHYKYVQGWWDGRDNYSGPSTRSVRPWDTCVLLKDCNSDDGHGNPDCQHCHQPNRSPILPDTQAEAQDSKSAEPSKCLDINPGCCGKCPMFEEPSPPEPVDDVEGGIATGFYCRECGSFIADPMCHTTDCSVYKRQQAKRPA